MRQSKPPDPGKAPAVRCAVYTRKSTEDGLEQAFNSLDARRESAEAYVKSQAPEGWTCLPDRYDDGGFTGGNMDRPALRHLLADIAAGKVDAVTHQINSATSMGLLMLNVLLSFAQFEREIISERTRDKIAATRRKGKWTGGKPLLGYDVDPRGSQLLVNEGEAVQVRCIFALYLEHRALLPVVRELNRRGWTTKCRVNKAGRKRGGRPFDRTNLHRLLTNVVYVGKVRYKDELHAGEQPALVDEETFQSVQALLRDHGRAGGGPGRNTLGFLLQGLLRCAACDCAMTPSQTRRGSRRYRNYTCVNAQKRGWDRCPSKAVPAGQMEAFVVEQIRAAGRDPAPFAPTVTGSRAGGEDGGAADRERGAGEVGPALAAFDRAWPALTPPEQARAVDQLVRRVDYDGGKETVTITFHPAGAEPPGAAGAAPTQEPNS
jgi:site-specific DNA recombinase